MDIALVADKGGVGKTTLCYHLCARFAQLGYDAALIDLDQSAAAYTWATETDVAGFAAYRFDLLDGTVPEHEVRIWDTPAHPSVELRRALARMCDLILVVAGPDLPSQQAAARVLRGFRELGAGSLQLLFNLVWPTGREGDDSIRTAEEAGLPCLPVAVRQYKAFQHCRWDSRGVCDGPYTSADQAWDDIRRATDSILSHLEVSHAA